jgi:hypothetical protein
VCATGCNAPATPLYRTDRLGFLPQGYWISAD